MSRLSKKLRFIFIVIAVLAAGNFGATIYVQSLQNDGGAVIDAAGRNRMLSQEIGFYAEQILKGNSSVKVLLGWAIDLHDSSFYALRDGGIATGIAGGRVLPATSPEVMPKVLAVEKLWVEYKKNAKIIAEQPTFIKNEINPEVEVAMYFIEKNGPEMLALNHDMVEGYVSVNYDKQSNLSLILLAMLVVNLIVIFIGVRTTHSVPDVITANE